MRIYEFMSPLINEIHIMYHNQIGRKKKSVHLQTYPTTFVAAATCAHAIILNGMPCLKKILFGTVLVFE